MKNKQEAYENRIGMSRNNDYTTGNSLNFSHHQNYCKLIGTDLSRETNTNIPQAINFTEKKLKKMIVQQYFLLLKSRKKLF